nr:hypothetical protein [Tanacetum cinerariifolium]
EQVESKSVDVVSNVTSSDVKTVESKVESVDVKNKGVYSTIETKHVKKNIFSPPIIDEWNSDDESEELMKLSTKLFDRVPGLEEAKIVQAKEIVKLKKRVKKLEKRRNSRPAGLRRLKKVGLSKQVESFEEKDSLGAQEDASKQGRSIEDIDLDAEIALVNESQGRMHDADMFGVDDLEVTATSVEDSDAPTTATTADVDDELTLAKTLIEIKAAKPKVISTTITTPKAKGIFFHEQVQAHIPIVFSSKDKGKAKMIEPEKPLKKKDQITLDEEATIDVDRQLAEQIQAQEKEQLSIEERSKLLAELIKSRRKYFAAKRAKEIRNKPPIKAHQKSLMSTPLSSKSPTIVNYKIYKEGKKSYFKIIRADGNSQNYLTFGTMFKNFNREDLEVLRSIVKERFNKTNPVDDMKNLLFQTLKTKFEPHVEDIIWKYQQGAVTVNNWKLFDSCEVYCVTTNNMVYYLLVEKMYPFTNNVLHQLWSDVRLQVDYEVEMSYDLLRLIRRQINEGYKPE